MSAIGAALRHDPPPLAAYAQPVEPVRPVPRITERNPGNSERGERAATQEQFPLRTDREAGGNNAARSFGQAASTVVPLPGRAPRNLDFAPFIAQQIAQQDVPHVETLDNSGAERAAAAYRQAAGDTDLVLGFVRSRRLTI